MGTDLGAAKRKRSQATFLAWRGMSAAVLHHEHVAGTASVACGRTRVRPCDIDLDQSQREPVRSCFLGFQGRPAMPIETAVVVAVIVLIFTGFGLTLAWAERQTRGIQSRDEKADAPVLAPSSSKA
jgi:hypothetical protein